MARPHKASGPEGPQYIVRPHCPGCGTQTVVFAIERTEAPDRDLISFKCPACKHVIETDFQYE